MFVTFNNNQKIPKIGFGSYLSNSPSDIVTIEKAIIEDGYRHIDTASVYKNEAEIGEVLERIFATTSIKREDLFITTKLWCSEKENITSALTASLKRLKLAYVDLYLIHFPLAYDGEMHAPNWKKIPMHVQWKGMEECVKLGLTKSIGVSNFNFQLLNDLLTYAEIRPVCNQIELHPYNSQYHLVEWMKKENIVPVAYSPLAKGSPNLDDKDVLIYDPFIIEIAKKHNKSSAQIILAWGIARGHVVIPKTSSPNRSKENYESLNVELTQDEVDGINSLNKNGRTVSHQVIKYLFGGVPLFE